MALPDEKKGEKILLLISGDVESVDLKQKLIDEKISPLMIPQEFIKVEGIPKLGSGKTDFSSVKKLAVEMAG